MDDVLPLILGTIAIVLLLMAGLAIYVLSFFTTVILAFGIVLSSISLILCPIIYWLIPNIDNKDAILVMRIIIILVFIASLAVLIANLIKAFAIR